MALVSKTKMFEKLYTSIHALLVPVKQDKLPAKVGEAADMLYEMRAMRLQMDKLVEACKTKEAEMREHIVNLLESQGLSSGRGALATVTITTKDQPSILDWDKLEAYLLKRKDLSLIQKRLSVTVVRDLLANDPKLSKDGIPGIEVLPIKDLAINKAGS